jgi:hypothetical protein
VTGGPLLEACEARDEKHYAGAFFTYTGAVASHVIVEDRADGLVAPIIFTMLTIVSWRLRPPAFGNLVSFDFPLSRAGVVTYWVITLILATECLMGGVMGALRLPPFIGIIRHLGYPAYFMTILGVWYVLAGVALLVPRFDRLKEWAYAGLVFNYTGAAASHLAVGDGAGTLVAPIIFAGLTLSYSAFNSSPRPHVASS